MTGETQSILLGTLGLSTAGVAALALAVSRPGVAVEHFHSVRWMSGLTLGAQSLHFAEEYVYQFNLQLPALLGLTRWPETFFVAFNFFWLAVWAIAIVSISKLPRAVTFPLWFLAIASAANGIAHPLIAIVVGGYFPGLWSSPLVGILGFVLLRKLSLSTSSKGKT
jgi:hypothetical protein